jgi:hypothetical protein
MRFQDIFVGIFWLILLYLVATNWKGVNALLTTSTAAGVATIKTLQGRG